MPFYGFAPERARSAPAGLPEGLVEAMDEFASLDRANTLRIAEAALPFLGSCPPSAWTRFVAAQLQELRVRCLTPASLLREAGLAASAIDAVVIDAEGQEPAILRALTALPGLEPLSLHFEWTTAFRRARDVLPLVRELAASGYDVHRNGQDIAALRAPERR